MADLSPTVAVEVELSGSGSGWTDIAADVLAEEGVFISRGIRGSGPTDLVATIGTATFALRNDARPGKPLGYYSLFHGSKRTGWDLGIGCRIRLTDPATSTVYTVFRGRIDAIAPVPGVSLGRRVRVSVVDWLDEAARWALTPDIGEQVAQRADAIMDAILDEMPAAPVAVSLATGTDVYPYALDQSEANRQTALAEFAKIAASEYAPVFVTGDGTLVLENRFTRRLDTTSLWTVDDDVLAGVDDGLVVPTSRDELLNTVRVTTHGREIGLTTETEVYRQTNVIRINAGVTQMLMGPFEDPVSGERIGATDLQPLVAGSDYEFNSDRSGAGTDATSDLVITSTAGASGIRMMVENSGASDGYLTRLVVRGRAIYDRGQRIAEATDAASVAAYGEHAVAVDMPYQSDPLIGEAAAAYLLDRYGTPSEQVRSIRVRGKSAAILTQILTREISDRITVSETVTGVSSDFHINGLDLTITPTLVEATYMLAPALPAGTTYWILGTSAFGGSEQLATF